MLNDLGIGSSGPPAPPPTTFSILPFPKHRERVKLEQTCFTFLIPSGLDEQEEDKKEEDLQASVVKVIWKNAFFVLAIQVTIVVKNLNFIGFKFRVCVCAVCSKDEAVAGSKSRSKATIKDSAVAKDKDKTGRESQRSKKQTSGRIKPQGSDYPDSRFQTSFPSEDQEHLENLKQKQSQM